jgi:hypothetical protein
MLKSNPGLISFNTIKKLNYTLLPCSVLLVVLTTMACNQRENVSVEKNRPKQNSQSTHIISEDEAVILISNLEEVQRKNELVAKNSQGKRHLSTYVETLPTLKDPNYYVKLAEDNGGSYVTYYIFAVHSKTKDISFYDVVNETLVSLNTWRHTTPTNER